MKKIVFTVTNDLTYDQRMIRICTSLQTAGYAVLLVGRRRRTSTAIEPQPFGQKRLACFFDKGFLFYAEYNIRLFFFLLFQSFDLVCAIDLDTIVPCYFASAIKKKERVYDAHELFCEMKEVVSRKNVYRVWKYIERKMVPKFHFGYTVNEPIKEILNADYGVNYKVIMNAPVLQPLVETEKQSFIMYQGAVNEGRSFETLIPAFQWIKYPLHIYGEGNFLDEALKLVKTYKLENKIVFKGKVLPAALKKITPSATMGITLFENNGLNNYYSLANRFFDYMHAGIPQLCVAYPVYNHINEQYKVATLIHDLSPQSIANAINGTLNDTALMEEMRQNTLRAREVYNWQAEAQKLVAYYQFIFNDK